MVRKSGGVVRTPPVALPETNIAPENGWLEDEFLLGMTYFQGLRQFQGVYGLRPPLAKRSHNFGPFKM